MIYFRGIICCIINPLTSPLGPRHGVRTLGIDPRRGSFLDYKNISSLLMISQIIQTIGNSVCYEPAVTVTHKEPRAETFSAPFTVVPHYVKRTNFIMTSAELIHMGALGLRICKALVKKSAFNVPYNRQLNYFTLKDCLNR